MVFQKGKKLNLTQTYLYESTFFFFLFYSSFFVFFRTYHQPSPNAMYMRRVSFTLHPVYFLKLFVDVPCWVWA